MSREAVARRDESARKRLPRRVLLVDDDDDFRESIAEILGDEGWEVTPARNGEEALALAQQLEDFVLLVDYRMPGLNGAQVFEHVQARLDSPVAAVLMTASSQVEQLAKQHGFRHHVGKPFLVEELFERLELARDAANDRA